ncbi:MAG: response regulator transcription factor [Planctomycetota bacterium]
MMTASDVQQTSHAGGTVKRVYVIDDDESVLEMTTLMLVHAGYDVVAYQSSERFVADCPSLLPGVVVTDQVMNHVAGTEVQKHLQSRPNHFRVILVTAFPQTSLAVAAMRNGAVTVLDKPFDRLELIGAVAEGFRQLHDVEVQDHFLPPVLPNNENYLGRLSEREREVIQLVYEGATNKAIGIQLGISVKTVEKHRGKAMKKMHVLSLAGLVRLMDRELGRTDRG